MDGFAKSPDISPAAHKDCPLQQHVFGVADVQLQLDTPHIHDCSYKKALVQPDSITDVQVGVARLMVIAGAMQPAGLDSYCLRCTPAESDVSMIRLQWATNAIP